MFLSKKYIFLVYINKTTQLLSKQIFCYIFLSNIHKILLEKGPKPKDIL